MTAWTAFLTAFLGALAALAALLVAAFLLRAFLLDRLVDRTLVRLLKDPYLENLWELAVGITRIPPHILMELELRAEEGKLLRRALGSIRNDLPHFSGLVFNPAQVVRQPLGPETPVDLAVTIGPRARHPLRVSIPLLISGMGYGLSLSEGACLALAQAATQVGTAYNAGSGPLHPEVRRAARRLILQYSGGAWTRDPDVLAQGQMVEIRYGHGARAGVGRVLQGQQLPPEARALLGLPESGRAVAAAPLPGAATPAELRQLVPQLRRLIGGGPVGVKLAAGHDLERDLAAVLEAGVDVIALDGAQGGSGSTCPILSDDFGLPTIYALHRGVQFLERTGARAEVSLIVSGGIRTPGECLKALALGADAVYMGTPLLMAAAHSQVSHSVPQEPVTQLLWANGNRTHLFDPEEGARTTANFLRSCAAELAEGLRALGKSRISEVAPTDLVALDRETAGILGVSPGWRPPEASATGRSSSVRQQPFVQVRRGTLRRVAKRDESSSD